MRGADVPARSGTNAFLGANSFWRLPRVLVESVAFIVAKDVRGRLKRWLRGGGQLVLAGSRTLSPRKKTAGSP